MTPTTSTSLASKREPGVIFFGGFDTISTTEGHEGGGARGNDDLLIVVPQNSHQQHPLSVFSYGLDKGAAFMPHAAPFYFFLFL
jgi:hypothetical protein